MAGKMWAGRFTKEVDERVNDFNSSISFDHRMYKQDIEGSMAHATMLGECGIIDKSESETIVNSSPSMTVAQAYLVGVAPVAGATFAIEKASFNGSSLTLTFPGDWPAGSYTVKYGATPECANKANIATATKTGSGNQVTIPLNFESGNVLYYKVTR